jgi:hypothetical protein
VRVPRTPGWRHGALGSGVRPGSMRRTTREKYIGRNFIFSVVSREGDGIAIAWKVILKASGGN